MKVRKFTLYQYLRFVNHRNHKLVKLYSKAILLYISSRDPKFILISISLSSVMYDVIIVGGGPAGLYTGENLASFGYSVLILEEHSDIGNPCHCSGLFSTHVFEIVEKIGILHPAKRARIYSPDGNFLDIGDERTRGYVVDRVTFDRELARRAIKKGALINLKERVRRVEYPKVITNKGEYTGHIIVGADGINSVVRKSIGIKSPRILGAVQIMARYETDDIEKVEIFLGNNVAPGFFAWSIPLFEDMAKIGLASYCCAWDYLRNLVKKLNVKPLSISGGGIPIGSVERSYSRGIILVGDAASQVKATSGGGIYPLLISASCAVKIINQALEKGDYSEKFLESYEKCWKEKIGKELSKTYYLHRIYRKIRDKDFNCIIRDLKDERIIETINEYGDIDYPSRVVFQILKKKPSLMKYLSIPARPYRKQLKASYR